MSGPKLCAISVDLDEISNYHEIHGLSEPEKATRTLVYDVAIPRWVHWSKTEGVPLTWFAIGVDLEREESADALRELYARGHEIGCHSYRHFYDLTQRTREEIRFEVRAGADAVERAVGARPLGFRAPGYTVTDELFAILEEEGFLYDSSVFPCPAYYVAKTLARGVIELRGRRSHSVQDTPEVLLAPRRPYRVGKPYYRRGEGMLELPIQVTRGLRLPFIGTALSLARASGARWLVRGVLGEPLVNLELHGVDALDVEDGLMGLGRHQPDLRIPTKQKLDVLSHSVQLLRESGYSFVTLREAASHF